MAVQVDPPLGHHHDGEFHDGHGGEQRRGERGPAPQGARTPHEPRQPSRDIPREEQGTKRAELTKTVNEETLKLFKRGAYNYAAVAHDDDALQEIEHGASAAFVELLEEESQG